MKFTLATLATLVSAALAANEFTSPSPNEVLKTGESFVVEWEPSDESSKVNLYLRKGDPDNLENVLTISKDLENGGAVRWTVPNSVEPGDEYAIEIQDAENEDEVNYSNQFTIEKGEGSAETSGASDNSTATTSGAAATTGAANATTSAPVTSGAVANSTAVTSGNATATSGIATSGAGNATATKTGGSASGTASGSGAASGSGSASGSASGSGAASGSGSGAASASSTTGGESGASTFAISSFVIAAGIAGAAFAF